MDCSRVHCTYARTTVKQAVMCITDSWLLLLLLLLFWSPLCKAGREWGHSISPKTPTPHNQRMEEEKDKTGDKKEREDHANRKVLALLLKPASPTPSNTGSLRLFQRDTERSTKLLRYWEVLQQGGANECLWATKAPRVTRAVTYGKGNAPLIGCIGLLLILNSMHNSATDRRWARLHSKTPPAKKTALLTTLFSSLRCESAAEHHTAEQYPWASLLTVEQWCTWCITLSQCTNWWGFIAGFKFRLSNVSFIAGIYFQHNYHISYLTYISIPHPPALLKMLNNTSRLNTNYC